MALTDDDIAAIRALIQNEIAEFEDEIVDGIDAAIQVDRTKPEARDQLSLAPAQAVSVDPDGSAQVLFDAEQDGSTHVMQTLGGASAGQRGFALQASGGGSYFMALSTDASGGGGGGVPTDWAQKLEDFPLGFYCYIGFTTDPAATTSEPKWLVQRITVDTGGDFVISEFSSPTSIWDDRALLSYS